MKKYFYIANLFLLLAVFQAEASTPTVQVKGDCVDILTAQPESTVFPQNNTFKFKVDLPIRLQGKYYTTTLIENEGVVQVKSDRKSDITIALSHSKEDMPGWKSTGEEFFISSVRKYYVYTYLYDTPGEWINVPGKQKDNAAPTLLFHDSIVWANPRPVPGTVIAKTEALKQVNLTNPTITILPSGEYLAAIAGALRQPKDKACTSFFLSSDKGKTWQIQSSGDIMVNYGNLFVHQGNTYIMGTAGVRKNVIICKSTDKGKTWTQPKDKDTGILLDGGYHSAPVPVVIHQGRIWRAMERTDKEGQRDAFVMSALVDADLLQASSWTVSEALAYQTDWIGENNSQFKQWVEGNVVVNREGQIVNVLRIDDEIQGSAAAIVTIDNLTKAYFEPLTDIIHFPGGGKKFTIRFDEKSNKYWTISNAVFEEDKGLRHSGIYKDGIHCGLIRNHLVLMHSDNLRDWIVKDTLISSNNPFFHGFQYVDWQFEGNDIIAVSRTAFEEERGLPTRQHDANFFLFHRFEDFREERSDNSATPQIATAQSIRPVAGEGVIELTGINNGESISLNVYDLMGRRILLLAQTSERYIPFRHKGVFILHIRQEKDIYPHKILFK